MSAIQVPLAMGFSRQEFWSELPCPPPGELLNPGIEPASLMSPAVEAQSLNYWTAREAPIYRDIYHGIFLKQRKGYNLNPQIGDWLRNYVSTVLMKNHVTRHVV